MAEPFKTILYEKRERILRITMNRPDKRNALSAEMLEELGRAFELADADRDACVVILTGAGDQAFSAGADLVSLSGSDGFLQKYEAQGLFPKLFHRMENLSKPTLARLNGHCVAGGFGLMMACDLAIARVGVKLGTPEVGRGLFPYMISQFILRAVPRRKALELMLLGQTFGAEDAAAWGIINLAVQPDKFDATVDEWATRLAGYSPAVLRLGRKALVRQHGMEFDSAMDYLQGLLMINSMTEDAMEGISAFFEKREPNFRGR